MEEEKDKKGFTGSDFGSKTIPILGELESRTKDGITVAAGTIYDYSKEKFQQTINEEYGQQIESLNNSFNEVVQDDIIPRLAEAEEKVDNNIPYIIVYENQYVNIPCDTYGNCLDDSSNIETKVKLYHGNIVENLAETNGIIVDSQGSEYQYILDEQSGDNSFASLSILGSNVKFLQDLTEVDFHLVGESETIVYGKIFFNKVKRGKSAYEEWKDANPSIENPTINRFLAELKNTDSINGPKYAPDIASAIEDLTIYFIPNSDTTKFDIWLREDSNTITRLAKEIPGDITNYAGIYDVSEDNKTGNTLKSYSGLSDAIADIVIKGVGKGGMTIKFIQGTGADAKYVQYRYLLTSIEQEDFGNTENWASVPTVTKNEDITPLKVRDGNGNVLIKAGSHIETKEFNSATSQANTGEAEFELFTENKSYDVGDIVRHGLRLYKFIAEHEAGEWNDAHVIPTNIYDETKLPITITLSELPVIEVRDKDGNVALRLSGGHFMTKYFNSANIEAGKFNIKDGYLLDNDNYVISTDTQTANVIRRANIFRTIKWMALDVVASGQHKSGDIATGLHEGLPYTSCMEVDKFVGFDVMLKTFMTCANNPYSLLYTEDLRNNTSGYGFTYHGERGTIGGYMGIVCNVFALHSVGAFIPWDTPAWDWASRNGILKKLDIQDLAYARIGDLAWQEGHGMVITSVKKESDGKNVEVTIEDSIEDFPRKVVYTSSKFADFMNGVSPQINGIRILYRFNKLYENMDYEEWDDNYVYNDDICTFAGDYACFRQGQTIFLNYNLKDDGNTKGWTHVQIYKDGNDTPIELQIDGSLHRIDISNGSTNNTPLGCGLYKARLKYGSTYSDYTYFEIVEAIASYDTQDGITKVTFSSANGKPIYVRWCTADGGPLGLYQLTEVDVVNEYVDIDVDKLITAQGKIFVDNGTYIKVGFQGIYGRVTSEPTIFNIQ